MAPAQPTLGFRRLRALTILAVVVALLIALVHVLRQPDTASPATGPAVTSSTTPAGAPTSTPVPTPVATPTPAPTPAPTGTPSQDQSTPPPRAEVIDDVVRDWHTDQSGHLAVAVVDLETGATASYGDVGHKFSTASIVKVDILATLLLQEQGHLSGTQRAVAARMIRQSSNADATTLWRQIGSERGLAAANERFGLTSTKGGTQGTWGLTTTTTADQLRLLQVVFTDDSPLTPDARTYLQSLMGSVEADQDWGVSAADSRGDTHAYVKNGWLPRTGGWIVNSVGKVEHEGHPVLVAALSDGGATMDRGIAVVERVSSASADAAARS